VIVTTSGRRLGYGGPRVPRTALAALAALAAVAVPAAGAATILGTPRAERLVGTARGDLLVGRGGADTIAARGGDDRIAAEGDGARDRVACGPGRDVVTADRTDVVAADCEVVSAPISADPYRTSGAQHRTEVEPDSFAHGSTVVAAFQVGRFFDGGAVGIGISTSRDAGRTWTPSLLPGLSQASVPPGRHPRVSDPVVAYDDAHGQWLVATLGVSAGSTELLVSRSTDGLRFGAPVVAAGSSSPSLAYDKEWLVCDSWPDSPFRGSCYLGYTDVARNVLGVRTSVDGGLTWGPQVSLGSGYFAMPAVQPDGTLVMLFLDGPDARPRLLAAVSRDGGASFAPRSTVADVAARRVGGLRAPPVPSAEVAGDGRVVVVWHDARTGGATDVVLSSSLDGVAWAEPVRVPAVPRGAWAFVPGVGVDPSSAGAETRIGVVAYGWRPGAGVDAWLATSLDGGATWGSPQRLSARTMAPAWIARTDQGTMLADYLSLSWADGRAVPVFSLASEPVGTEHRLRQAVAALVRGP
jgi:hypothetical protein